MCVWVAVPGSVGIWKGLFGDEGWKERKRATGRVNGSKKIAWNKKRVALNGGVLGSGGGRIRPDEIPIVISRNQIGYQTTYIKAQYASRVPLASRCLGLREFACV